MATRTTSNQPLEATTTAPPTPLSTLAKRTAEAVAESNADRSEDVSQVLDAVVAGQTVAVQAVEFTSRAMLEGMEKVRQESWISCPPASATTLRPNRNSFAAATLMRNLGGSDAVHQDRDGPVRRRVEAADGDRLRGNPAIRQHQRLILPACLLLVVRTRRKSPR